MDVLSICNDDRGGEGWSWVGGTGNKPTWCAMTMCVSHREPGLVNSTLLRGRSRKKEKKKEKGKEKKKRRWRIGR